MTQAQPSPPVRMRPGGPWVVAPDVPLWRVDPAARPGGDEVRPVTPELKRDSYTLCRCGQSGRRPFCDGTHRGLDLHDAGSGDVPADCSSPPDAGEPATVVDSPDVPGPRPAVVLVDGGPMVLLGGAVRLPEGTMAGARLVLCRCGESTAMPCCDGRACAADDARP